MSAFRASFEGSVLVTMSTISAMREMQLLWTFSRSYCPHPDLHPSPGFIPFSFPVSGSLHWDVVRLSRTSTEVSPLLHSLETLHPGTPFNEEEQVPVRHREGLRG